MVIFDRLTLRPYSGATVKWWARGVLLARSIVLSPILLLEFGAIRGRRPVRWESGAILWVNSLNASSGGWLQTLFARLTFRPIFSCDSKSHVDPRTFRTDFEPLSILDDGFQIIEPLLSVRECDQIVASASSAPVTDDFGVAYDTLSTWLSTEQASDRAFLQIDVDHFLQACVLGNRPLHSTVKAFLRADPLIVSVQAWATRSPKSVIDAKRDPSGMMFHCDADYLNFVKLFVPLTDASLTGGATEFVRFSHKQRRHVLGRINEDEAYASGEVVRADCAVGSGYLCATTGWHRAGRPDRGVRLIAQILFSADLLGRKPPQQFPIPWVL